MFKPKRSAHRARPQTIPFGYTTPRLEHIRTLTYGNGILRWKPQHQADSTLEVVLTHAVPNWYRRLKTTSQHERQKGDRAIL